MIISKEFQNEVFLGNNPLPTNVTIKNGPNNEEPQMSRPTTILILEKAKRRWWKDYLLGSKYWSYIVMRMRRACRFHFKAGKTFLHVLALLLDHSPLNLF